MWKKDEATPDSPQQEDAPPRRSAAPGAAGSPADPATIGRSITIRGEVSGDEDLLIQGTLDGSVELRQHSVTVGPEGRVTARITARIVTVEGEVEGDLVAQEQIILRASARVNGDMTAPRVVLEDGATFRGMVDMSEGSGDGKAAGGSRDRAAGRPGGKSGGAGVGKGDEPGGGGPSSGGSTGGSPGASGGSSHGEKKDAPGSADEAAS